ncbi:MAG: allophanate hydrolase [Porticoccaceae bacterium]|nr:allophanate hydrolase [Porticoccaceae bacterium]
MKPNPAMESISLSISSLKTGYADGSLSPVDVVAEVYRRIESRGQDHVWTVLSDKSLALKNAQDLLSAEPDSLPLYGIPFSVKDNIHVQGLPTTASCPGFSHFPDQTAVVVTKLLAAGAILIGKNTMDQFATGLVGVRSPGHPVNSFNPEYIPGGSSSGSGVAVAVGLVSFSLGSDTGGSGRIPAALNNIVGLKPTPGVISTQGMIYANRSFDCVPIFALTCDDAKQVFDQAAGPDIEDPFLRARQESANTVPDSFDQLVVAIPDVKNRQFFGDVLAEQCFNDAIVKAKAMGAEVTEIDFTHFLEAGKMLFDGPLLAERYSSLESFLDTNPQQVNSNVKAIVEKAKQYSAVDLCKEYYRITELKALTRAVFSNIDILMVPTAGTIYRIDEVEANPVNLNTNMGYYTYYANILQLSAIAVPAAIREDGLPFGVCFLAGPQDDASLAALGSIWQQSTDLLLGDNAGFR